MSTILRSLALAHILMLLAGCGGDSASSANTPAPLPTENINLVFVVSPDLAYHADGDLHRDTANLTSQGLQRSLLLASYLQRQVLGSSTVSRIYALQPMSHRQTANATPDLNALLYIEPFAMQNQITLTSGGNSTSSIGVNGDLKLIQISTNQRFKTDTRPGFDFVFFRHIDLVGWAAGPAGKRPMPDDAQSVVTAFLA